MPAFLTFPLSVLVSTQLALLPASTQVAAGPQGQGAAVSAIVGDIIGYTRWPVPPAPVRLCLAGAPHHAGRLGAIMLPSGQGVRVQQVAVPAPVEGGDCDVLYVGGLDAPHARALLAGARGRAVLTIAEDDDRCRGGAMICLHVGATSIGFELNVDAVSRGAVRIDPRVLRLSRGWEKVE
ncbi:YfiR family protein [Sphingobium aquiterrae]|uniref:YfiR family protein n=1 Tax=Sphingobium aquiterrae TaxID=2038656 RepID=UPI0030162226